MQGIRARCESAVSSVARVFEDDFDTVTTSEGKNKGNRARQEQTLE